MTKEDFDTLWKFHALKLAALESLDLYGKIDTNVVFIRAKDIYNSGYEFELDKWKTFWTGEKEPEKVVVKPAKIIKVAKTKNTQVKLDSNVQICSKCGEEVPNTWTRHAYRKNGEKCGQELK